MIQSQINTITEDAAPNQTLYVNNLNEKVKIEGIKKNYATAR